MATKKTNAIAAAAEDKSYPKRITRKGFDKMLELQKQYIDKGDKKNADDIARNAAAIDVLAGYNSVVGDFPQGTTDYIAKDVWGDPKHLLELWWPVLIDTTDNARQVTKARRLQRNNILRFVDGSFAPAVCITQAMYDECMTNDLYTESDGDYTQVYATGAFDAARQWETDKVFIKAGQPIPALYKKVEEEYIPVDHILRPWETTETKYTHGVANTITMYLADNQKSASGKYIKGIFFNDTPYDGINLAPWKLPPTAIGPCPMTTIQDVNDGNKVKARCFFYLYKGMTNCASNQGLLPSNPLFEADRTYPRTNDVQQVNNMNWARNNNATPVPYPFAEGGHFAHNVFITALELAAGQRYIHQANIFGSGMSSNDGCTAANFFTSGGTRIKKPDTETWTYKAWGTSASPMAYNASGATDNMAGIFTNHWPKEQCMESQLAASMAVELGIAPTLAEDAAESPNTFEMYGNTYYYMNVPGFDGLQEGSMNVRVYKIIKGTLPAFEGSEPQDWDVEIIERMSLFNGVNLCGDIWAYYGGGLEMVGTPFEGATAGSQGNTIRIYAQPDQTKWHSETAFTKPAGQKFDFQDDYIFLLETTNLGDSYTLEREGYTPWKIQKASAMNQGECYHQWDNAHWINGTNNVRVRSLFRSRSYHAYCSPRSLTADYAASTTNRHISGSVQALVEIV